MSTVSKMSNRANARKNIGGATSRLEGVNRLISADLVRSGTEMVQAERQFKEMWKIRLACLTEVTGNKFKYDKSSHIES